MGFVSDIVQDLLEAAVETDDSADALRFSQAALNAAHCNSAYGGLPTRKRDQQKGQPMTTMRAKMRVSSVDTSLSGAEVLTFNAVAKSDGYPADGSDDDNTYAKWSPSGELKLTVANPNLHGKFAVGDKFYLDFHPAK